MNIYLLPAKKYAKPVLSEQHKRIAFHTAGQAAAIYLRNKRMNLPSVPFRVLINIPQSQQQAFKLTPIKRYQIRIEGGQLVKSFAVSLTEVTDELVRQQQQYYQQLSDADIINIMAGPIAEAKYVAERDNEIITPRLVSFNALGFYNGMDEITTVSNYLQNRRLNAEEQHKTMINLYLTSFIFVGDAPVWRAINELANHFLTTQQMILEADEIGTVLDGIKPKFTSTLAG